MKDKKLKSEVSYLGIEPLERRWLNHAKHESKIFEADEIKQAMKEGWKFWPWEVNVKEKTVKEVEKKEAVIPIEIEEVDLPVSANEEVTKSNDSDNPTNLVDTISEEEIEECLQRQQQK